MEGDDEGIVLFVVLRRREEDDEEYSLPICFSSNERKNARAFSTALFVDAEC